MSKNTGGRQEHEQEGQEEKDQDRRKRKGENNTGRCKGGRKVGQKRTKRKRWVDLNMIAKRLKKK